MDNNNTILIGKKVCHRGALLGTVSNGGKIQVGNIIIEFVAQSGDFRHVQVYQQGLGATPVKQTWVKTKKGKTIIKEKEKIVTKVVERKVPVEKIVYREPEKKKKKLTTTFTDEVITL